MSVFAIADLHLSLGSDKPMDVFPGWGGYVERLRENWLRTVAEGDTVVLPGDFSWAMRLSDLTAAAAFLHSLPGKKLLLKGNHDYWWSTVRQMRNWFSDNGFSSIDVLHNDARAVEGVAVCGTRGWFFEESDNSDPKVFAREVGRLEFSLTAAAKTGLEPVAFLHFPPYYAGFSCPEIVALLHKYGVKRCYYGHIHGKTAASRAVQGEVDGITYRLVACDALSFTPLRVL